MDHICAALLAKKMMIIMPMLTMSNKHVHFADDNKRMPPILKHYCYGLVIKFFLVCKRQLHHHINEPL